MKEQKPKTKLKRKEEEKKKEKREVLKPEIKRGEIPFWKFRSVDINRLIKKFEEIEVPKLLSLPKFFSTKYQIKLGMKEAKTLKSEVIQLPTRYTSKKYKFYISIFHAFPPSSEIIKISSLKRTHYNFQPSVIESELLIPEKISLPSLSLSRFTYEARLSKMEEVSLPRRIEIPAPKETLIKEVEKEKLAIVERAAVETPAIGRGEEIEKIIPLEEILFYKYAKAIISGITEKPIILFIACSNEFLDYFLEYLENLMINYYLIPRSKTKSISSRISDEEKKKLFEDICEEDKYNLIIFRKVFPNFFLNEEKLDEGFIDKLEDLKTRRNKIIVFQCPINIELGFDEVKYDFSSKIKDIVKEIRKTYPLTFSVVSNEKNIDELFQIISSLVGVESLDVEDYIKLLEEPKSRLACLTLIRQKLLNEIIANHRQFGPKIEDEGWEHYAGKLLFAKHFVEKYGKRALQRMEIEFEHQETNIEGNLVKVCDVIFKPERIWIEVIEKHTDGNVIQYINDRILTLIKDAGFDIKELWFGVTPFLSIQSYKEIKKAIKNLKEDQRIKNEIKVFTYNFSDRKIVSIEETYAKFLKKRDDLRV